MSEPFSTADLVRWTGGSLLGSGEAARFSGVSIDTRSLQTGDLFVAIRGERHDAHGFLAQAVSGGAAGLVIERDRSGEAENLFEELPVIAVTDTTTALGALAAGHRASFEGPLVAITGSSGKTTTKEMCAAILSQAAPCLKTAGNLNN